MKRYRGILVFALALLVFLGFLGYSFSQDQAEEQRPPVSISVVLQGENDARWRALELGIRQACGELGIENPAVIVRGDDAASQTARLTREVAGGAQGLLVAAADSTDMRSYLEEVNRTVPVVLVETPVGERLDCVHADDEALGRLLARQLAGEGQGVAVMQPGGRRQSVQARLDAFLAEARQLALQVTLLDASGGADGALAAALAADAPQVLVALDNDALEAAIDAVPVSMRPVRLVGVGASDKAVHALDTGAVEALCYVNEYAMGYQAAMRLAQRLGLAGRPPASALQYGIATRQNMYQPEVERILFPVTQ